MVRKVQIIPNLATLTTNVGQIPACYYVSQLKDFFPLEKGSLFNFAYYVKSKILDTRKPVKLQFGNFSFYGDKWQYLSKKSFLNFQAVIDEKSHTLSLNRVYYKLPTGVGGLFPSGSLLSDYINYVFEKNNIYCLSGSAVRIFDKTFLFMGSGRNFKTTLLSLCLDYGGYYIAEEIVIVKNRHVYGTIPVFPTKFDTRTSHKDLFRKDLKQASLDKSVYDKVIFLIYSDKNEIKEISLKKANEYAEGFYRNGKYFFYDFLKLRDQILDKKRLEKIKIFPSEKVKYSVVFFKNIENVYKILEKI